jgi:hypothetical protein
MVSIKRFFINQRLPNGTKDAVPGTPPYSVKRLAREKAIIKTGQTIFERHELPLVETGFFVLYAAYSVLKV